MYYIDNNLLFTKELDIIKNMLKKSIKNGGK